jgi:hypothetical protein
VSNFSAACLIIEKNLRDSRREKSAEWSGLNVIGMEKNMLFTFRLKFAYSQFNFSDFGSQNRPERWQRIEPRTELSALVYILRRNRETGIIICSRYLATVRRATLDPSFLSISAIF